MPYDYIFDDDLTPAEICGVLFTILIIVLSIWAFTGKKTYTDKYGRKRRKWPTWLIATIMFAAQIGIQTYGALHMINFRKHMATVTGIVLSKQWHSGRNTGWSVYYRYAVKGKSYESANARSYHDYERDSARKNNQYIVIYDSTDPGHGIMDLHEPVR